MGGELPAVIPEALGNFAHLLSIRFNVRILALVGGIGAVAEDAVVTGHGNDALCAAVGEVRVLLNKLVENRNQVVGADRNGTVVHDHLVHGLSVRPDYDILRKAISVHVLVIVDIILREYKSGLAGRKHNIAPDHLLAAGRRIVLLVCDIVNPD